MHALMLEPEPGLGMMSEAGLEPLDDRELGELTGGSLFVAALWVAGGIGGLLVAGVIVGAAVYVFTH
jgi:hypothetical protein